MKVLDWFKVLWIAPMICCVAGIFIEDREKSWIQHNHGLITSYDMLLLNQLVAITDANEIIKYQFDSQNSQKLQWKIPVLETIVDYQIQGQVILVTTSTGTLIFDSITGELISDEKFGPSVASLPQGLVLLSESNQVHGLQVTNVSTLIPVNITTSAFKASSVGDEIYLVTKESQLYKLNSQWEVTDTKPLSSISFNSIDDMVGSTVLVSGSRSYNVDSETLITSQKYLHLVTPEISYSFHNHQFQIFHNDKLISSNEFEVADNKLSFIGNKFIIQGYDGWEILDVSKFLVTLDENSIVVDNLNSTQILQFNPEKLYSFSLSGITSVNVVDNSVQVSTYDISQEETNSSNYPLNIYKLTHQKSLLINKPESSQTSRSIESLIDEINKNNMFIRWGKRLKRHLHELGRYVVGRFSSVVDQESIHIENPFNFEKLLVYVDNHDTLVATDSLNGITVWKTKIRSDKDLVELIQNNDLQVSLVYPDEIVNVNIRDGSVEESSSAPIASHNNESIYVELLDDSTLTGYTYEGKLVPSWRFHTSNKIFKYKFHGDHKLNSIGIARHDKSVLYKYLDYNLISVFTIDKDNNLKFYLINGETGSTVYYHEHPNDENVDLSTVNIVMQDNWVIYSYYIRSPKPQQQILVLDLFTDKLNNLNYSVKSFIFPNKIISLESTFSKFGVTLKSILALTDIGELIELPKYILNSRRIDDRVLTPDDQRDDFRMMPYEPIIYKNNYQVLNHQHKLELDKENQILIDNTKLESTIIVCLINNNNKFCSRLQPSLTFDVLPENFDRVKLILTIIIIILVYLVTNPMVLRKKLNNNWKYTS